MKNFNIKALATLTAITMAGVFSACGDTSPTQGAGVSIDEDGIIADNNISSDSQDPTSSDSQLPVLSSSSQLPSISSSSAFKPVVSSSSIYIPPVVGCKTRAIGCVIILGDNEWYGIEGIYQIETGMDNGNKNSGYWYDFNDSEEGGKSYIEWPVEKGNEYSDKAMDPIIDYCGGVCGTAHFDKGPLEVVDPFVGVGFNLVGEDDDGNVQSGDISKWTEICIQYSSDIPASLALGFTEEYARDSLKFDVPIVTLQKAASATYKCFEMSRFKQAGWGIKQPLENMLKQVTSINIGFSDKSVTEARFNITGIGWYGEGTPNK